MPGCRGRPLIGSGYRKETVRDSKISPDVFALLAARDAQIAALFPPLSENHQRPVDPNPPMPLRVAGPGNSSTTTTSNQGTKSPATS
jgi:hypothetical protein